MALQIDGTVKSPIIVNVLIIRICLSISFYLFIHCLLKISCTVMSMSIVTLI